METSRPGSSSSASLHLEAAAEPQPRQVSTPLRSTTPQAYGALADLDILNRRATSSPSIRAGGLASISRSANVSESAAISKPPGEFLGVADILDPHSLEGKVLGKDYVLLLHKPHSDAVASQIRQSGLKSLRRLAADDAPPEFTQQKINIAEGFSKYNKFAPDLGLIYFRPVSSSMYPVRKDDFVIAVRPESANVFNQEHRVKEWGTPGGYKGSSLNIRDYEALRQSAPPGRFVSQYKTVMPWDAAQRGVEMYYPEVCVNADHIDSSLFVPHSAIDDSLKKTSLY